MRPPSIDEIMDAEDPLSILLAREEEDAESEVRSSQFENLQAMYIARCSIEQGGEALRTRDQDQRPGRITIINYGTINLK